MTNPYRIGDLVQFRPVVGGIVKGKIVGFQAEGSRLYAKVRVTNRMRVASYCPGEIALFGVKDAFLSKRERKAQHAK